MARLRFNNCFGTLGADQQIGDGTLTLSAPLTYADGTPVPTIAAPNTLDITVDPRTTNFEVERITAYTQGSNVVTVTRAISGAAKQHLKPAAWTHDATVDDYGSISLETNAANIGVETFGAAAAAGSTGKAADAGHVHQMPSAPGGWPSSHLPTGALYETYPRDCIRGSNNAPASGQLLLSAIYLPTGLTIGHLVVVSGQTGASSPTHWWFALYDSTFHQLATTADQLTAAFAAKTAKSLAIATIASGASSTFTTTYSGLHYIGIMMAASGPVQLSDAGDTTGAAGTNIAPLLGGGSDSGQTTPPAFPHTAATPSDVGAPGRFYAYVAT